MNFKILKEVILSLKNKIKCPSCNKRFTDKEMVITNLSKDKLVSECSCSNCELQSIIEISLSPAKDVKKNVEGRQQQGLKVNAVTINNISQDDVLDFKNFIKDFSGDFKSLFKK